MTNVTIYATETCLYCIKAKKLLDQKKVAYETIAVDKHPELRAEMTAKTGRTSVPQIFINDKAIGGCDDLYALEAQGKLDPLLKG